ncbi:class I SAM-dependent methyltransferase [Fusibacter bizertensis]|uniref:Class I SAM-dependent methyltransferase n=1 Tax=Fusibacter bizertensis TaxID=1488331 RepID=A0ABT6NA83_9FIRM|nr:class I SAM-dependent methyltransferase [Fusibacter bizertensis]MDH8677324.1 class I SAM-dependent methyltransferase [Fusibacter bizertensis]
MIRQLTAFTKNIWSLYLVEGMQVLDATLGNGEDASFICEKIGKNGLLEGIDIQEEAVKQTRVKLEENGYQNYKLSVGNHKHIDTIYKERSFDLIVYNLGYLPKSNKTCTTLLDSTAESIQKALKLIKLGGILSITSYRGHDEGVKEYQWLSLFMKQLDAKRYHVMKFEYMNQGDQTPALILVERKL